MRRSLTLAGLILLLALVFGVLVTANSAGYRFGISDQAFYIPAIDLWRWPDLFPRDRLLLEPQARLTVIDETFGWICRATGLSLEPVFFFAYACTIVVFAAGVALVGRSLFRSPWAIAALMVALSLRHRIPETAANTFEGYFHPRVLAFALGLVGIGLFLHARAPVGARRGGVGRRRTPHDGRLVPGVAGRRRVGDGVCSNAMDRRNRRCGDRAGRRAWSHASELAARLTIMDPAWIAAFSGRDYVFPTSSWSVGTWLTLLVGPAIVLAVSMWRRRTGNSSPPERAIALGALSALWHFSSVAAAHRRARGAGCPVADLARLLADRVSGDGLRRVGARRSTVDGHTSTHAGADRDGDSAGGCGGSWLLRPAHRTPQSTRRRLAAGDGLAPSGSMDCRDDAA